MLLKFHRLFKHRMTDQITCLMTSIYDLGAMFTTIKTASEEYTQPRELAGIGQYLSQDWGNTAVHYLEQLEARSRKI